MVRVKHANLCDLVEIRMALESWAARRAAERATPEQVDTIGRIIASMGASMGKGAGQAAVHPPAHSADDEMDFHLAVAQAAGSPVYLHLLATIRDILGHLLEAHHTEPFTEGSEALLVDHHRAIYDAIAKRDPDAAAAAVTAHLGWVLDRYHRMRLPE
nr:FCD domain-containing protein [Azospirillum sp. SYSU D00513]